MKTNKNTILEPELIVGSQDGVYIPRTFLQVICAEIKAQIPSEDRVLLRDINHENHIEAWADVLDREYKFKRQKVTIEQINGDVWIVPACFARSKAYREFNPEF